MEVETKKEMIELKECSSQSSSPAPAENFFAGAFIGVFLGVGLVYLIGRRPP